ncbi:YolD-like family protein [Bacillus sp. V33-4]|uniref:YolD-like family protein n=1 Tax=Bacillus sp. V33-4 TaxID=2054169 RepID=UPI000C78F39C|nr:YolD-like family protein [Bacillus sp. V33-4]PLR84538.1 YolD-like family protein [Bacillus sp. V33-4]
MIRDRGKIKWTSMMLPEHVKLLHGWAEQDTFEKKGEPDEQQLELMNETIAEAMEFRKTVTITHYRDHHHELVIGTIHYWDEMTRRLHIVDRFDTFHRLQLADIVDVQFTDD